MGFQSLFSAVFWNYFIINYHLALETDLTDTLTGTSVICHQLPSCLGNRLDRHSHRYICSPPSSRDISSSTTTSYWRQTWQTLSQVNLSSFITFHPRHGDRLDRHSHRYICHMSSTTILPWRQTWQTLSQVLLSSVITCHLAMETDMSDTLTGTSVALRVLKLFHHQLPHRIGDRLDRHSYRYICHLSSSTFSPWKLICQTLSQGTSVLHRVLEIFHHQLPLRLGDRLDRHSHRHISYLSSPTISPWRPTWQTFTQVHLFSSPF